MLGGTFLIRRILYFFPEALPSAASASLSAQTSHPLACKFSDGTSASSTLDSQALSTPVPTWLLEPVLIAWALLPPRGMPPHLGATLPDPLPPGKARQVSLRPACWLFCPQQALQSSAPLDLPSGTCTSPGCGAVRQQDMLSALCQPGRGWQVSGGEGAMKQPLPMAPLLQEPPVCPLPSLTLDFLLLHTFFSLFKCFPPLPSPPK